jgi:hypothetical protein
MASRDQLQTKKNYGCEPQGASRQDSPRRWMMITVEQPVEWELAGETEVLGETLPQCHSVHHKSQVTLSELEPGPPLLEAGD